MILPRINAGASTLDSTFIYVFGGRNEGDKFYDSVERYNSEMNLWTLLEIRLPTALSNHFVFPFANDNNGNEDNIIVLGGLKPKRDSRISHTG